MMFSIIPATIYIPTNSVEVFPFLYIFTDTYYICFFNNSHRNKDEVIIVVLIYISMLISDAEHFFRYLLAIYMSSWKNIYSVL